MLVRTMLHAVRVTIARVTLRVIAALMVRPILPSSCVIIASLMSVSYGRTAGAEKAEEIATTPISITKAAAEAEQEREQDG